MHTCPALPKQLSTIFIRRIFASQFTEMIKKRIYIILIFEKNTFVFESIEICVYLHFFPFGKQIIILNPWKCTNTKNNQQRQQQQQIIAIDAFKNNFEAENSCWFQNRIKLVLCCVMFMVWIFYFKYELKNSRTIFSTSKAIADNATTNAGYSTVLSCLCFFG